MDASPWTCPFCSLLCDGYRVELAGELRLQGTDCPRAQAGLSHFGAAPTSTPPRIRGEVADEASAIATAAQWLRRSRLPLFGGLATDVAGARALYRLAAQCGAISDHAAGRSLFHGLRAQQDRGVFYTTLAEARNRADLIVCLGTSPTEHYPEFFRRCGVGEDLVAQRHVVFVDAAPDATLQGLTGVSSEAIAAQGDLFDTLAVLNALVAGRVVVGADPALATLAERLRGARYAVIVWEAAQLSTHGALVAEGLQQLVATLNRHTRAASFSLGGSDGAYSANQVATWMSGLPLRTHAGRAGLEHDPLRFDAQRLLDDGAVDLLLWTSSFGPAPVVPPTSLPRVVLGHPAMALPAGEVVFIPVSTPGIGSAGHLFRTDGGVVLPLRPLYEDTLPDVATVVERIARQMAAEAAP
jgi:formylmethanofuran dehydrogenase subunit B